MMRMHAIVSALSLDGVSMRPWFGHGIMIHRFRSTALANETETKYSRLPRHKRKPL